MVAASTSVWILKSRNHARVKGFLDQTEVGFQAKLILQRLEGRLLGPR